MPKRENNRKPLSPGMTLEVVSVTRGFSPRYGEFAIVKDVSGTEWYSFSQPIMATFFGSATKEAISLPATVSIESNTSKAGRTFLTATVA